MTDLEKFFVQSCETWLCGAMLPSEVCWLYRKILESKAEVLIECGRQDGYSTRLFAKLLAPHNIKIYSIDFDEDLHRLEKTKKMLEGYDVECVSGDIHVRVPELLAKLKGKRIAIVQDGPKGWEGMATLMASVFIYEPVLVAQHNLHRGHKSREAFQLMSVSPAFLEFDKSAQDIVALRGKEIDALKNKTLNRDIEDTSLGCTVLDEFNILELRENIRLLESQMKPWSPIKVAECWRRGDYSCVSRLRANQKRRLYRFKKR